MIVSDIAMEDAPHDLGPALDSIFTSDALMFVKELVLTFDERVEELFTQRLETKLNIKKGWIPEFTTSPERLDKTWSIAPLPKRLQNRKLDLGDVSPANTTHFVDSLNADVQGIQVDFDDGHCPTWRNTILGLHNVYLAVKGTLKGAPIDIGIAPILMMRPRAWNMIEHHFIVKGKEVPGPLFDFGILMFHCAKILMEKESGPYFYLSKIESHHETQLWNDIFVWSQNKLGIPQGTIKACVLIENICAAFCLDEILYSLKDHSLGLNCGIWDYAASIISKFGHQETFLIPDRNKYVNMDKHFLDSYLKLVVQTCHARGAPATGGMAAKLLPPSKNEEWNKIVDDIVNAKAKEIKNGVDGFMVYDARVVPYINELWKRETGENPNQIVEVNRTLTITATDLLTIPEGGVTTDGLRHNITVAMLFIYHWLEGKGHFYLNMCVEDSATAEISRSQLWQWIRHSPIVEDKLNIRVRLADVEFLLDTIYKSFTKSLCKNDQDRKRLKASKFMLLELVTARECPEFITTFLNDNHKFRSLHNKSDTLFCKL